MPAKFDRMVSDILKQLKKENPKEKDSLLKSRAFAIATAQWKKSHGGKLPTESKKDWHVIEYQVPFENIVTERFGGKEAFLVKGIAINETITRNNVKYVAEELEKGYPSLKNKPILKDHKNEIDSIVGRTTEDVYFDKNIKAIRFTGQIMDETVKQMIKDGRITNVSIGARVSELEQHEGADGKYVVARGIDFLELSLVPVPGDACATISQALEESFKLKQSDDYDEEFDPEDLTGVEDIEERIAEKDDYIRYRKELNEDLHNFVFESLNTSLGIYYISGYTKENKKEILSYLFEKSKGWDKMKVKSWIMSHFYNKPMEECL